MLFGLGQAASAMTAQGEALQVWANDLANAQTPGFEAAQPVLAEAPPTGLAGEAPSPPTGSVASGTELVATAPAGGQALTATGRATDLALTGSGYFVVQQGGRRLLTRDGSFSVDGSGTLVTADGAQVLGSSLVPIRIPPGQPVGVADGVVTAGGRPVARLAIAQVPNPAGLLPSGAGTYAVTASSGAPTFSAAAPGQVLSGYLNASSASLESALTGLVGVEAAFQIAAKVASQAENLASLTAQLPT